MANTISGFYQTVVAAATEASQAPVYNLKLVDSIYKDVRTEETAAIGQTINVVIPAVRTAGVLDAGVGDMTLTDVSETTVPIVMNKHPQDALVIRNYEQFNSPVLLRQLFFDSALKGIKENINATIGGAVNSTNFAANAPIATTAHIVTTTQLLSAMAVLSDQRVPVQGDPDNMSLLLPSVPYTAVLGDANWTQAQIAGMQTAQFVRERGELPVAYGCSVKLEQQMTVTGAAPTRSFTGIYMHRYAICLVSRPLPKPDTKVVDFTYVDFGGIPILVTLGYNQYPKQGYILSVEAGYGLAVTRPSFGQLFTIAE